MKQLFLEAGEITGQTFEISERMRGQIEEAGFTNVHEKVYKNPIGSWPADPKLKELGRWTQLGFDIGLEGYALATLTRVLGWNTTEVHVLLFVALSKLARTRLIFLQGTSAAGYQRQKDTLIS